MHASSSVSMHAMYRNVLNYWPYMHSTSTRPPSIDPQCVLHTHVRCMSTHQRARDDRPRSACSYVGVLQMIDYAPPPSTVLLHANNACSDQIELSTLNASGRSFAQLVSSDLSRPINLRPMQPYRAIMVLDDEMMMHNP